MCGQGHYTMRVVVIVESQLEFNAWLSTKPAQSEVATGGGTQPAAPATTTDTTAANRATGKLMN
ncbi:MAG: hypothetical protein ABR503_12980 [Chitinophagaceae bacterium]